MRDATDWLKKISHAAWPISRHYQHPGSDVSSLWNVCARFSDVIFAGKLVVLKCRLFSQDKSVKVPISKVRGTNRNHCRMTYSQSGTPVLLIFGVRWLRKPNQMNANTQTEFLSCVCLREHAYNHPLGLKGGYYILGKIHFHVIFLKIDKHIIPSF